MGPTRIRTAVAWHGGITENGVPRCCLKGKARRPTRRRIGPRPCALLSDASLSERKHVCKLQVAFNLKLNRHGRPGSAGTRTASLRVLAYAVNLHIGPSGRRCLGLLKAEHEPERPSQRGRRAY